MKLLIFLILLTFLCSCSQDKDVINKINETDSIQTVYPFVDLKSYEIQNTKDSLVVEINFKDLETEIEYDNPNLTIGYPEYSIQGWTFVDSMTRLLFRISYSNEDTILKQMKKMPFGEFIKKNCKKIVAKEVKHNANSYDLFILDTIPNLLVDKEKIIFKINKKVLDTKISSETVVNSFRNNLSLYVFYDKPRKGCSVIYYQDYLESPNDRSTDADRGVDSSNCR